MRTPTLLAGLVLAVSALSGCGGGSGGGDTGATDTETYCAQLTKDKKYFNAFGGEGNIDPSQFDEALERFHALADVAPDDISPQWDVLDGTLTQVERSLAEAGISTEDLAGLQSGKIPKGVDMTKLAGLAKKFQALNSPELQDAAKKIQTHAKKACGVDLAAKS